MHAENPLSAFDIRTIHRNTPVKSTWPQQCGVQYIRTVGRGHQDDTLVGLKTVHLNKQLIQCLLSLIVPAAKTSATMTAHRIDLINKNNAWRVLFTLFEQVANTRGTNANKHLHKIGTTYGEKRHVGFSSHCTREQGFSGSWRPHQQNTLWNSTSQFLKLLWFAQELNNLLEFVLWLIYTGNILKRNFLLGTGREFRSTLSKRQCFVSTALDLPHEENPKTKNK